MYAEALAHPNIALIKYWGKRDAALNLPAVGSISITLDTLETRTRVEFGPDLTEDRVYLNGRTDDAETAKVGKFLDLFRKISGKSYFALVESKNNFATGAGLASSASGYAAMAVAADAALGLELGSEKLSELARRGSGSASRSLFGGFVEWSLGSNPDGSDSVSRQLLDRKEWPLEVVIAVTSKERKPVSSSKGMNLTMDTSPFYPAWVSSQESDLDAARNAIAAKDFGRLADISEYSCLKMHASAFAANPGIIYWNSATLACMQTIRELRKAGISVFFTVDAGPQVKAVCTPIAAGAVAEALSDVAGVKDVLRAGLGGPAHTIS